MDNSLEVTCLEGHGVHVAQGAQAGEVPVNSQSRPILTIAVVVVNFGEDLCSHQAIDHKDHKTMSGKPRMTTRDKTYRPKTKMIFKQ